MIEPTPNIFEGLLFALMLIAMFGLIMAALDWYDGDGA